MQFKVGDRVRVVAHMHDDPEWLNVGDEYEVAEAYDESNYYPYHLRGPAGNEPVRADQLELVSDSTVYKLQVPEEPAGVDRVRPVGVTDWHFEQRGPYWYPSTHEFSQGIGWLELLNRYPQGVELVPSGSDFEVSLDYLRRNPHVLDGLAASGVTGSHAAAVVRGALAKEEGSE